MSTSPSFSHAEYIDAPVVNAPSRPDTALFARSLVFGLGGVIAGAAVDAAVIGLTHLNIGYLAIGVAWLVAKAMVLGSRGQGGRFYQIAAIVLTYVSVSLAHASLAYVELHRDGPVPLSLHNIIALMSYGLRYPILHVQNDGPMALIGILILLIGMRAAWRMTSGDPSAVRHPFAR